MQQYDRALLEWIHTFSSTMLDSFFVFVTNLGSTRVVTMIVIVLVLLFSIRGWYMQALRLSAVVVGAVVTSSVIKLIVARPRPELWHGPVVEATYSFPSSHATASMALALFVVLLAWPTRWRWLASSAALVYVLLIATSRLYLGVHYLTDVVGGWLFAGAWVYLVWWMSKRLKLKIS